jgi:hypothetical protein
MSGRFGGFMNALLIVTAMVLAWAAFIGSIVLLKWAVKALMAP